MSLASVADLRGRRILVVGDLILDQYLTGDVPRISPEAPVPVLHVSKEEAKLGGAANVAANLMSLGANPRLIGVVGQDVAGRVLKEKVLQQGMVASGIRVDRLRPTVQKTRMLARHQQVLRVDREHVEPLSEAVESKVLAVIEKELPKADAVILSDYGKGVLTPRIIAAVCAGDAEVFVDPKGKDYSKYRGADVVTPNAAEAEAATGIDTSTLNGCKEAAEKLMREVKLRAVVLTRGAQGIYFRGLAGDEGQVPTRARSVFDVTGAGDTVIAVLALARAAQRTLAESVELANAAAGVVVERLGTARVTPEQLERGVQNSASTHPKITTLQQAVAQVKVHKIKGRRIVFTNGCFDLLHAGHIEVLEFARAQGDCLVVAINDDASVRRQKGATRPVQPLASRQRVLAALSCVDLVFAFSDNTPEAVIQAISPDVLVKGEDWKKLGVVGREWVESRGGRVELAPLIGDHSTSKIIASIQKNSARGKEFRRGSGRGR